MSIGPHGHGPGIVKLSAGEPSGRDGHSHFWLSEGSRDLRISPAFHCPFGSCPVIFIVDSFADSSKWQSTGESSTRPHFGQFVRRLGKAPTTRSLTSMLAARRPQWKQRLGVECALIERANDSQRPSSAYFVLNK